MYSVVRQVPSVVGSQWVTAPVEVAPAGGQPTTAFTLNQRSFPTLSSEDDYAYIDIHDNNLLDAARKVFPAVGSLYQAKPGVSSEEMTGPTRVGKALIQSD